MARRRSGRGQVALIALCALVASTCSRDAAIPALDPADEVELVEIDPAPGDESYVWAHAFEVEGAPPVNVGHPTAEFLEAAVRIPDDPNLYLCFGDERGVSDFACEVEDPDRPAVVGLTFGTSDVHAWAWAFVPEEAAAVQFTDQDGRTTWQRPRDRVVIFPDTVTADAEGECACQLDAMNADGAVIDSVDLETLSSLGGES